MTTPSQASAPHAYPFKPENTKGGYGAIDIVVNVYTPEAIAENRIPTDANFSDKVRLNSAYGNGVTMEQYLEKMDRVLSLWNPWFSAWRKDPDRADLWALGWMLMEFRISIFAPNIPVRFSVSEKKIRLDLERCIHSGLSS